MKSFIKYVVLSFLMLPLILNAEVIDKADQGFHLESKVTVNHSAEDAYQQFLKVGEWWNGDHSWFGSAENFSLEAKAGGCFCEVQGDQQVEHMRVVFVNPNKEMRWVGGLGPLQGMGLSGTMTWKFEADEDNKATTITHSYVLHGYSKQGLKDLAEIVDKVQTEQLMRLAKKLEN